MSSPTPSWGNPQWIAPGNGAPERPHVVLIVLDSLRADRVGAYGYPRATTPAIDAFASRSAVFEHAVSQASWTLPSLSSLMTSLYPSMLGVTERNHAISEETVSLARLLRDEGYATAAFTGGGFAGRHWGMDRGFERFWEGASAEAMNAQLEGWLASGPPRPFFLFLHSYELHDYVFNRPHHVAEAERLLGRPLKIPENVSKSLVEDAGRLTSEDLAEIAALYDGGVRSANHLFEQWMALLAASGALDNAGVVLVADHGEGFGEHGVVAHGFSLYEELIHVPLILGRFGSLEGSGEPRRIAETVELVEVAPTLLEIAAVAPPAGFQGRSALRLLQSGQTEQDNLDETAFSEGAPVQYAFFSPPDKYVDSDLSVLDGKALPAGLAEAVERCMRRDASEPLFCEELFELEEDPGETVNRALSQTEELYRSRERLAAALVERTPGLKVWAGTGRGEAALRVRVVHPRRSFPARIFFSETADGLDPRGVRLDLGAGDFDLAAWEVITEEDLGEVEVHLSRDAQGTGPVAIGVGPGCEPLPPGSTVIRVSDVPAPMDDEVSLPSLSEHLVACVFFTTRRSPQAKPWEATPEALDRLRSLGYLK